MQIPISLLIYKEILYMGFLDGHIISFPNSQKTNLAPEHRIFKIEGSPILMHAHRDILYILTEDKLYYALTEADFSHPEVLKESENCDFFDIDKKNNLIFLMSHSDGFLSIKYKKNHKPSFKVLRSFSKSMNEEFHNDITCITISDDSIFFSERGEGLFRSFYKEVNNEFELQRTIDKISVRDIQEFKYNKKNKCLYILDDREGFLIQNIQTGQVVLHLNEASHYGLRSIIFDKENAFISTKQGLFYYDANSRLLSKLNEIKTSAMISYYNWLVFLSNGQLNIVSIHSSDRQKNNKTKLFSKLPNFLKFPNQSTRYWDFSRSSKEFIELTNEQ